MSLISLNSFSQVIEETFYTRTSNGGSDVMVASGVFENKNFKNRKAINVFQKNAKHNSVVFRTYLNFDLSSIPSNAIIVDARLSLTPKKVNNKKDHSLYIESVNSPWSRTTIKWNNQPEANSSRATLFPDSLTSNQSIVHEFNITSHVQDMVSYPTRNYGIRMRLKDENLASKQGFGIRYYSSRADSLNYHPRLLIKYVMPVEISTSVTHCTPGNNDGSADITLTGGSGVYSNFALYNIYRDPNDSTKQKSTPITSGTISGNTINIQNLDAGLYVVRISNPDYSGFTYRHFLVGREGETTDVIIAHYAFIDETKIGVNLGSSASTSDYANTNFGPGTTSLAVATTGIASYGGTNAYHFASLLNLNMDIDADLEFSKADLHMLSWFYYQTWTSSNEAQYSAVTSPWDQNIVTWNSRPTIDSTQKVILAPSSNPNGYSSGMDTIDIRSMMTYWQNNPNYGLEIALTEYEQPKGAHRTQRKFGGGSYFNLTFKVKEKLIASYDEEKEEGSITVNAPDGNLPYTYLISYDSIPSLDTLWANIKDSTFIDSTFFYQGKVNSKTYVFDGLEAENYHVAIFDNNGDLIYQGEQYVTPTILFYENTNISLNSPYKLIDSTSSGNGVFFAELPVEKDGGFEFVLEEYGALNIGFLGLTDSLINSDTTYSYGISLDSYGKGNVYFEHVLVDSFTVPVGGLIRLGKEDNKYYLDIDHIRVSEQIIQNAENLKAGINIEQNSGATLSAFKLIKYFVKPKPFHISIENLDCSSSETEANVTLVAPPPIFYYNNFNITVTNILTQAIVYTGTSNNVTIQLPVGVYKATFSYSYSLPIYSTQPYSGSSEFVVGYPVNWLYDNPTANITETPLNTISPTNLNTLGKANSFNKTPSGDWWYKYGVDVKQASYVSIDFKNNNSVYKVTIQNYGGNILNKEVFVNGVQIATVTNNKDFLITQLNGNVELRNNNFGNVLNNNSFPNTISGLMINVEEYRKASLKNNYLSYCSKPNYFVAKTQKQIYGDYYQAINNELIFQYSGEYNKSNLRYKLIDPIGNLVQNSLYTVEELNTPGQSEKKNADNRYKITFNNALSGFYVLRVTNVKGEVEFIRIKI